MAAPAWAAHTQGEVLRSKTQLVVKLATEEQLSVRSRFEQNPPTIVIEFPGGRVAGMLPERSAIQKGVIQEIQTAYASSGPSPDSRWIQALRVQLRAPYDYQIRTEPGRVIIDIEHPAEVTREDIEVGVARGIVVSGTAPQVFSERFRAMQEALTKAQPFTWQTGALASGGLELQAKGLVTAPRPQPSTSLQASPPLKAPSRSSRRSASSAAWWVIGAVALGLMGGWRARQRRARRAPARSGIAGGPTASIPSGIQLIDQLVWRAFERQGYQLLQATESSEPLGLIRVVVKEGAKAALLCVGEGAFFEKTAVEQFVHWMRQAKVEQGFLIVPGSFTVPAQRCAKEHGITLIGRDQLMELLSEGAMNEYYTKRLQQLHAQVEEAKETLSQYAKQLDAIRRQRNEASWLLGEERAKSGKLEAQVAELTQQVSQWQAQAAQWQQSAEAMKKQWEENQWYLGESRAACQHRDEQIQALEASAARLDAHGRQLEARMQDVERQRDEANWYLGESRAAQDAQQQQIQQLTDQLATAQRATEELQRLLDGERAHRRIAEAQLAARANGERRQAARFNRPDLTIEIQRSGGEDILFRGAPRDVSKTGFGFDAEHPLHDGQDFLHIRLCPQSGGRPIEATGRLIWQRQDESTRRTIGGCQFLDISADYREAFEQALANPA